MVNAESMCNEVEKGRRVARGGSGGILNSNFRRGCTYFPHQRKVSFGYIVSMSAIDAVSLS